MRIGRFVGVAVVVLRVASGQDVSGVVSTPTGIVLEVSGAAARTVAPGTLLGSGLVLENSVVNANFTALARTTVTYAEAPDALTLRIVDHVDARAIGLFANAFASCGPLFPQPFGNDFVLTVTAARPVAARWVIERVATIGAAVQVDFDNDGSVDAYLFGAQPISISTPAQFAAGVAVIRVKTWAQVSVSPSPPQASADGDLVVRLVPDAGVSVRTIAPACAGLPMFLTAPENFRRGVDLRLSMVPADQGLGVFVFGHAAAPVTIPVPPGCLLGTAPFFVAPFVQSPALTARLPLDLMTVRRPFVFEVQGLWLETLRNQLAASETLRIAGQ